MLVWRRRTKVKILFERLYNVALLCMFQATILLADYIGHFKTLLCMLALWQIYWVDIV